MPSHTPRSSTPERSADGGGVVIRAGGHRGHPRRDTSRDTGAGVSGCSRRPPAGGPEPLCPGQDVFPCMRMHPHAPVRREFKSPSDTQTGAISPNRHHSNTRSPVVSRPPSRPAFPRGEAAMTAPAEVATLSRASNAQL